MRMYSGIPEASSGHHVARDEVDLGCRSVYEHLDVWMRLLVWILPVDRNEVP